MCRSILTALLLSALLAACGGGDPEDCLKTIDPVHWPHEAASGPTREPVCR